MIPYFFFFNDTATTEIYTLSLHDALPISHRDHYRQAEAPAGEGRGAGAEADSGDHERCALTGGAHREPRLRQLLAAFPAAAPGTQPQDRRGGGAFGQARPALQTRQGSARTGERRRRPADPRLSEAHPRRGPDIVSQVFELPPLLLALAFVLVGLAAYFLGRRKDRKSTRLN